jgi:hypothetical protein
MGKGKRRRERESRERGGSIGGRWERTMRAAKEEERERKSGRQTDI